MSLIGNGMQEEPIYAPLSVKVRHQPHHNVMTESAVHFHDAGGKKPARLLFCEFIDNSIEALRRQNGGQGSGDATIEIILIYKTQSGVYKLHNIVILDHGSGMSQEQRARVESHLSCAVDARSPAPRPRLCGRHCEPGRLSRRSRSSRFRTVFDRRTADVGRMRDHAGPSS